jgi:hypothetical protein
MRLSVVGDEKVSRITSTLCSQKWTILAGLAFLGSLLWSFTFRDSFAGMFLILFCGLCFVLTSTARIVLQIARGTKQV